LLLLCFFVNSACPKGFYSGCRETKDVELIDTASTNYNVHQKSPNKKAHPVTRAGFHL
jgi:hypothetical protein